MYQTKYTLDTQIFHKKKEKRKYICDTYKEISHKFKFYKKKPTNVKENFTCLYYVYVGIRIGIYSI